MNNSPGASKALIVMASLFLLCTGFIHGAAVEGAGNGDDLVNLLEAAKKAGIALYWDSLTGSGMLEKNGRRAIFRADESLLLLDYRRLAITDAPRLDKGALVVSQKFVDTLWDFFSIPQNQNLGDFYRVGAIVIDPGHGGKDPGAFATHTINGKKNTVYEKDINLAAAKLLYDQLSGAFSDKKILLTRKDDRFLSLEERVEIANSVPLGEREAILFISIHVNASLNNKSTGFEVWYLSPGYRRTVLNNSVDIEDKSLLRIFNDMLEEEYTEESIQIAKSISDGLAAQIGSQSPNRGTKPEEWFVVRNANMPSVLVEIGFLSNPKEAALLMDDTYLRKISTGIYTGLVGFVRQFENIRGALDSP
jgi:N-acetylmuramoyl-L-alanine amidase